LSRNCVCIASTLMYTVWSGVAKALSSYPNWFSAPPLQRIPELEKVLRAIWSTSGPMQDSSTSLLSSPLCPFKPFTHRLSLCLSFLY
jgi:hypothetical protein